VEAAWDPHQPISVPGLWSLNILLASRTCTMYPTNCYIWIPDAEVTDTSRSTEIYCAKIYAWLSGL